MAKRKLKLASLPIVDEKTAKAFDEFLAAKEAIKPLSKEEKKKKAAQKLLEERFDALECDRFALPDGRIVQRIRKGRQMEAKEAHTQEWWEITEAAA